jgi:hypothetical protein
MKERRITGASGASGASQQTISDTYKGFNLTKR